VKSAKEPKAKMTIKKSAAGAKVKIGFYIESMCIYNVYVHIYNVYVYICVCVCVYIYIYIYIVM